MQTYVSEKNANLKSIKSSISHYQADKNACISDYNKINSIRNTINSYRSEADIIVNDLKTCVEECNSKHVAYSNTVKTHQTEFEQMSKIIQTTTDIIDKQNVSKNDYTAHITQYKSDVANIHDSVNKSISNYNLERLSINSIQTTIDKYKLESNLIINNLKDAISNAKFEYDVLINKNSPEDNETLRSKLNIIERDRNLVRNEYLELHKLWNITISWLL